jgi:hypothetical protein
MRRQVHEQISKFFQAIKQIFDFPKKVIQGTFLKITWFSGTILCQAISTGQMMDILRELVDS